MNTLFWSIKRELWENRSIVVAPLVVAALFLTGFFVSLVRFPSRMRSTLALELVEQRQAIEQPYVLAAIMLMGIAIVVAAIYSLDALYGERRDRSVLFWKSLPVSDVTTVLAKGSIPILVIPVVTFVLTVLTQLVMLVTSTAVLLASGISAEPLWVHVSMGQTTMINFGHLVVYHGLWYAPFFGWMLLVSAWANRAPFVWAILPPVAIGVVERVAFNTSHFAGALRDRFMGEPTAGSSGSGMTMDMLAPHSFVHYLASLGFWVGLAITALFLFAAVQMRRSRGPI